MGENYEPVKDRMSSVRADEEKNFILKGRVTRIIHYLLHVQAR